MNLYQDLMKDIDKLSNIKTLNLIYEKYELITFDSRYKEAEFDSIDKEIYVVGVNSALAHAKLIKNEYNKFSNSYTAKKAKGNIDHEVVLEKIKVNSMTKYYENPEILVDLLNLAENIKKDWNIYGRNATEEEQKKHSEEIINLCYKYGLLFFSDFFWENYSIQNRAGYGFSLKDFKQILIYLHDDFTKWRKLKQSDLKYFMNFYNNGNFDMQKSLESSIVKKAIKRVKSSRNALKRAKESGINNVSEKELKPVNTKKMITIEEAISKVIEEEKESLTFSNLKYPLCSPHEIYISYDKDKKSYGIEISTKTILDVAIFQFKMLMVNQPDSESRCGIDYCKKCGKLFYINHKAEKYCDICKIDQNKNDVRNYRARQKKKIIELYKNGIPIKQLAEKYKKTETQIEKWIKEE